MSYTAPSKVFTHADRLAAWQAGKRPAPVTVELDLSWRCSLGCQHCHFAHTHTRGPWASRERDVPDDFAGGGDLMNTELAFGIMSELASEGVEGLIYSGGGEPTTHPEWERIVEHGTAVGLAQGMYTLGGLLTPDSAGILARNMTWVVVSLDAPDAIAYEAEKGVDGFERACDGIRWLVSTGSTVAGASFLLHADNWERAPRMLELARELGADYTTFRPTIQTSPTDPTVCSEDRGWIEDALQLFWELSDEPDVEIDPDRFAMYAQWERHGRTYPACYGIRMNTTVTPDGRVWKCPQHRGVNGSCLGDLSRESFAEVWARHPGEHTDFSKCRVMCRLHQVNETLDAVFREYQHEEFV